MCGGPPLPPSAASTYARPTSAFEPAVSRRTRRRSASDANSSGMREDPSGLRNEQTLGVEELQHRLLPAENRRRDELAAHEPQHVPVAGVAARDPGAVVLRETPDDRQEVEHEPEDAGPSMRDRQLAADEVVHERFERLLDAGSRLLVGGELGVHRDVSKSAGEDAPAGILLPVVEPVPTVVR